MTRVRFAPAAVALLLVQLGTAPTHAAPSYRISRAPDPAPDDPLREEKLTDRKRVAELNRQQYRTTGARDRASVQRRDSTNARAQARYRQAMADWRRQVAACRGGDWSQCDHR